MNEQIKEAIEKLRSIGTNETVKIEISITHDETSISLIERSPYGLVGDGITMRNIYGQWIEPRD